MTKCFCDRCRKEIEPTGKFILKINYDSTLGVSPLGGLLSPLPNGSFDICFDCREEFDKWMGGDDE